MTEDLEFRIRLRDLKTLSNALCELDSLKRRGDQRVADMVAAGHGAIIRALGAQADLVYDTEEA